MNQMRKFAILAAVFVLPVWSAWASEAAPGASVTLEEYRNSLRRTVLDDAQPAFTVMDKNHDGKVTLKEFGESRAVAFREFDKNGDGVLTLDEYKAMAERRDLLAAMVVAYMVRWDANRDGLLQKSEFHGRPGAFVEADKDENNVLHHAELVALLANSKPLQYSPELFFKAHDLDGDGVITESEWLGVEKDSALFDFIDANGDGMLRMPEVQNFLFRYERRLSPLPEPEEKGPAAGALAPAETPQPLKILSGKEPSAKRPLPPDFEGKKAPGEKKPNSK
ncbi:MAG: EF-hand domain-containing protein [Candidatus Sumerlaeota bacterium]|nr:EF-hand domain-containing protein [Candidatus Sumerlaeota bacterium]